MELILDREWQILHARRKHFLVARAVLLNLVQIAPTRPPVRQTYQWLPVCRKGHVSRWRAQRLHVRDRRMMQMVGPVGIPNGASTAVMPATDKEIHMNLPF